MTEMSRCVQRISSRTYSRSEVPRLNSPDADLYSSCHRSQHLGDYSVVYILAAASFAVCGS